MDIKLNARLSAYSKVTADQPSCPVGTVTKEEIDNLFTDVDDPTSVTKSEIDTLFNNEDEPTNVTKSDIDTLFDPFTEEIKSVSHADIDRLFQ